MNGLKTTSGQNRMPVNMKNQEKEALKFLKVKTEVTLPLNRPVCPQFLPFHQVRCAAKAILSLIKGNPDVSALFTAFKLLERSLC